MTAEYRPVQANHRPAESWLKVDEVAAFLRISRMSVYRAVKEGEIIGHRFGRSIRISERDLDRYLHGTDMSGWVDEA